MTTPHTADVSHTERITCPSCGMVQDADVFDGEGFPFLVYVHECIGCAYIITESEWNVVEADCKRETQ